MFQKKLKDNLKARRTLKEIGVRKHLWPVERSKGKYYLPPAPYNLSNSAKDRFCEVLENVKFPDGYASNISRCVMKRKLSGLKSHDCHVLMQLFLPIAMRESVTEKVASVLIELCDFFRALCSKTLIVQELTDLKSKVVITLCNMEKIFPPTFFTIMVHLVVHLADEAIIAGPVHYRWMYPIESSYVRNKACPEGSIASGYLLQECLTYCSRYMADVDGRVNRSTRSNALASDEPTEVSDLFASTGQPYGKIEGFMMDERQEVQAHRYVLFNSDCKEIEALRDEHIAFLKRIHRRSRPTQLQLDRMHNEQFSDWLKNFVNDPCNKSYDRISDDVKALATGPMHVAKRFHAFDTNNCYRFCTEDYERNKKTQNSGVMVVAKTQSYASTRDTRPTVGEVTYYGVLDDIIELNYYNKFKIVLFKCDWADINHASGIKIDKLKFTLVNLSRSMYSGNRLTDEPFVFSSQVHQVIYVQDRTARDWYIPIPIKPRDTFDMGDEDSEPNHLMEFNETQTSSCVHDQQNVEIDIDDLTWMSSDVQGMNVVEKLSTV
ncbi:uncharacterized protein LOC110711232 isoform X2 [Chenopodium quinoa]|uniref:uncharacterized protein LOC110711232 isoform X2 n=1 Tax=Chenopodium quinoa TaxID=63459 RepID=UPI000B78BE4C|nr:uncharacterized protein LOC110711232 isoform X2 [Chenopodium quinoa]